jgi:argininosuccinate lyase
VTGLAAQAMAVAGSLPGGYHRDLQLVKGPLMEGLDTVDAMLAMVAGAVPRLGVDRARCAAAVGGDLLATDEVYRRVRDGVPFRSAYRQVAAEVRAGVEPPPLSAAEILATRHQLGGAGAPALGDLGRSASRAARRLRAHRDAFDAAMERLAGGRGGGP